MNGFSPAYLWYLFMSFIGDIFVSVFRPMPFVLPFSMIAMFIVMYGREHGWTLRDFAAQAVRAWRRSFAGSSLFRTEFLLVLYTLLVLFKTIFLRVTWLDPFSDVFGGWGFYDIDGNFSLEAIENFILFIPLALLLSSVLHRVTQEEGTHSDAWVFRCASRTTIVFSLVIEFLQALLQLGTLQLADLVYNTAGGVLGAALFYLIIRIKSRR